MNADTDTRCPYDDCTEAVHVTWFLGYTLSGDDFDGAAPVQSEAHSESWQIECSAGHVLLLPDQLRCCDDPEGPDCTHDPDEYDWSDDTKILRSRDLTRLRETMGRISGGS